MNEDAASLDRLHDIVLPPPVPWWPLAPGWYVLGVVVLLLLLALAFRAWLRRRRTAYRREALRSLRTANDVAEIAMLLRRTALAEFPREEIAVLHGDAWADWLSARSREPMPPLLRGQLTTGAYSADATTNLEALRAWTARWIASHNA